MTTETKGEVMRRVLGIEELEREVKANTHIADPLRPSELERQKSAYRRAKDRDRQARYRARKKEREANRGKP
jgi:hypothetical protein